MKTKRRNLQLLCTVASFALALWAATTAPASTIAYWKFEPGNLTLDSSGNGNTLANTGVTSSADVSPTAIGGGGSTGSALFNGAAFFKSISDVGFSAANASHQMTVEWFMKPISPPSVAIVMETGTPLHAANGTFGVDTQTSSILEMAQFSSSSNDHPSWPGALSGWHHYALEFDETNPNGMTGGTPGTDTEILLYRDGTLVNQTSVPGAGIPTALNYADAIMYLGARTDSGTSLFYNGLLDEIRISTGLLAPNQFLDTVPEPSTILLFGLGGLLVWRRARKVFRK